MAFVNPSKPAGLSPVRYLNGAKYDGKVQIYSILAANTNPFYIGDIVALVSGGAATAADANGIPAITLATANTSLTLGAVVAMGTLPAGVYANPNNLNITNRPAGAQPINYYAAISDDPNIIYEIQEGGAGTNLTPSAVGRYARFIYAAPATGVAVSGTQLDNGNATATAVTDLLVMRLVPRIDNHFVTVPATGGGGQKWWVMLGKHQYMVRPAAI